MAKKLFDQNGFSIFETILAVTIISVLTLIALPKLITYNDEQRVEQEAILLVSELRYLQELTKTSAKWNSAIPNTTYDNTPYMIFGTDSYYIQRNNTYIHKRMLPSDMKWHINRNGNTIQFSSNGDAPTCTISMHIGNAHRDIIIDSAGRVRVE